MQALYQPQVSGLFVTSKHPSEGHYCSLSVVFVLSHACVSAIACQLAHLVGEAEEETKAMRCEIGWIYLHTIISFGLLSL
jgi:hypothetical protein